jgi:hypothetical protein
MDISTIWNEICDRVNALKARLAPESEFQSLFETAFMEIGWSRLRGEIISQKEIPIGAANRLIPDIVISANGKNLFVVELKRPSNGLVERYFDQLRSYMLQLKLIFGVFIGENIQVLYDDPNDDEQPIIIATIKVEKDNTDGPELFALISKDGYSEEAVIEYYKKRKADQDNLRKVKEVIDQLVSDQENHLLQKLLVSHLDKMYGSEIAGRVLESLIVTIAKKPTTIETSDPTGKPPPPPGEKIGKYAQYSFSKLFKENLLSEKDIANLCDPGFSNRELGTRGWQYPVLQEIQPGSSVKDACRDDKGRSRYYANIVLSFGNRRFMLSSQWYDEQRLQLEQYMKSKGLSEK